MNNPGNANRVAAALDYLRACHQYFEFDNQERIVRVSIRGVTNADAIAEHVGQLRDVERLTFERTDLSDKGLGHLKGLTKVRTLWLGSPNIGAGGLSQLVNMTGLEKLVLEDATLDLQCFDVISGFRKLAKLSFDYGHCRDRDLEPLGALDTLEEFSSCEIENLDGTFCKYLVNLPRLRYLAPGEHLIDEALTYIAQLANLDELFLNGPFKDTGLRQIGSLKNLRTLYITSDNVTTDGLTGISELPALARLGLDMPFTDACVPVLARCKSLTSLTLFRSDMTEAGRRQLREALPDCEIDDLQNAP